MENLPIIQKTKDMKKESEFPFEKARRVTPEESQKFREAISEQLGIELKKRGDYLKLKDELFAQDSVASLYSKILEFQESKSI